MDEFDVAFKARQFVREANVVDIPASVEAYAEAAAAVVRADADLGPEESGWCFAKAGKQYISVNANQSPERQRFTICHEIAHIVLGLPSDHKALLWWSYAKRPPAEIWCDIFAAELLLPFQPFKTAANEVPIAMAAVETLAARFSASITATGSRFAAVNNDPCAFVLSEQGKIRYAARSNVLRGEYAWIKPGIDLPRGCLSERLRAGTATDGREKIDAEEWFTDWERGGVLLEEAKYLAQWDQTLTLLWFEDCEVPSAKRERREDEEELGLEELDGNLRWPSKKRRR
jgi:Zn-dependent peptidase ImmA (M78 family)